MGSEAVELGSSTAEEEETVRGAGSVALLIIGSKGAPAGEDAGLVEGVSTGGEDGFSAGEGEGVAGAGVDFGEVVVEDPPGRFVDPSWCLILMSRTGVVAIHLTPMGLLVLASIRCEAILNMVEVDRRVDVIRRHETVALCRSNGFLSKVAE